jgi:hypothetical protein
MSGIVIFVAYGTEAASIFPRPAVTQALGSSSSHVRTTITTTTSSDSMS